MGLLLLSHLLQWENIGYIMLSTTTEKEAIIRSDEMTRGNSVSALSTMESLFASGMIMLLWALHQPHIVFTQKEKPKGNYKKKINLYCWKAFDGWECMQLQLHTKYLRKEMALANIYMAYWCCNTKFLATQKEQWSDAAPTILQKRYCTMLHHKIWRSIRTLEGQWLPNNLYLGM